MENINDKDLVTELAKEAIQAIKTYPGRDPNQPIGEDDIKPIIAIVISGVISVPLNEIAAGRDQNAIAVIMNAAKALNRSLKRLHSPSRN